MVGNVNACAHPAPSARAVAKTRRQGTAYREGWSDEPSCSTSRHRTKHPVNDSGRPRFPPARGQALGRETRVVITARAAVKVRLDRASQTGKRGIPGGQVGSRTREDPTRGVDWVAAGLTAAQPAAARVPASAARRRKIMQRAHSLPIGPERPPPSSLNDGEDGPLRNRRAAPVAC